MNGYRPMGGVGLGALHHPIPIPKLQTHALVKTSHSTRALYMVPRPNLGGDSIYAFHLVHPRPMRISHEKTTLLQALTPTYITIKWTILLINYK